MIDIEELKRKALACQAFHAAGCPVDDPHDTYPPDHYDSAVQPKYILQLIERLEAAERDSLKYRALLASAGDREPESLEKLLPAHLRPLYIRPDTIHQFEAAHDIQMIAHILVSERHGKFDLIHLVAYLMDASLAKEKL